MKPYLLLLVGCAVGSAADLNDFAFLAGCWQVTSKDGSVVSEMWNKPQGGSMQGIGRTVSGGKTVFTEYLQIREEKGVPTYFALLQMKGDATPFALEKASATEIIFSNPQHDYPTRIIYRKQPDGGLFARVEGLQKGKVVGEDFPYRRAKCE